MARPELGHLQDQRNFDRAMGRTPRNYAGGTSFVQPSLAAFTPPSSPGVAKGISTLSAFAPKERLARSVTIPRAGVKGVLANTSMRPRIRGALGA